jgi:putative Mn2+ efflux pump MntP
LTGLILVAVAVGMSNVGAAVGVACAGIDRRTGAWILGCFFVFETGMPLVGLAIGEGLSSAVGASGRWLAGALLVGVGVGAVVHARRGSDHVFTQRFSVGEIVGASFVLSIDNLVVGFALGTFGVPVVIAALVIGSISVSMSAIALELGSRLARLVQNSELLAATVLIAVGFAVLTHTL